jgi:hypothetical protein
MRERLDVLRTAVNMACSGSHAAARDLIAVVGNEDILHWCVEHGQMSGIHRHRALGRITGAQVGLGTGPRSPSPLLTVNVWRRDGFHCRYCGIPVVPKRVLKAFSTLVGADVFPVGRTNAENHGAALIACAQIDHVVPYNQGGATDQNNLVTACWACNFGKDRFTLAQIGLDDPRARQQNYPGWDGGWPLITKHPIP